jgi:hypothetical protein
MTNACHRLVGFGLAALALAVLTSPPAVAGTYRPNFVATCENGHSYPIRAKAISDEGELVTGELLTGRRGATYIRLVPVGFGYRYAARGLWLDGWRSDADLNFGKHRSIVCTVALG